MKKCLLFLLITISNTCLFSQSSAIEFEIVRTKETPGFFLLKIYNSNDLAPIKKRNVFIKNFKKSEKNKYEPIIEIIEDLGGKIEDKKFLGKNKSNDNIFILGEPIGTYKNLDIEKQDVIKEFEEFQKEHLENTYLEDLELSFGGNISDVYIKNEKLTDKDPINIIGRFSNARKTRIEIYGTAQEGKIALSTNLPLDEMTRSNDPLAEYLPELWEKTKANTFAEDTYESRIQIFPILLFSTGLLLILFVVGSLYKEKKSQKKKEKIIPENSPTNIQKSSEPLPHGLPFEIEFNSSSQKKK